MPDPEALNLESAFNSEGHVNTHSSNCPSMMFNAELAVSGGHIAARALVDTGATHCYISQSFSERTGLPLRNDHTWLSLANGSKAVSKGKAVIPLDVQTCQGAVECFNLPMSQHSDIILGETWCVETGCEISYKSHSLTCVDTDGRRHKLLTQSTETSMLCPIISAVHLEELTA